MVSEIKAWISLHTPQSKSRINIVDVRCWLLNITFCVHFINLASSTDMIQLRSSIDLIKLQKSQLYSIHITHFLFHNILAKLKDIFLESLRLRDAYMCQYTRSSLVQIMACRLDCTMPLPELMTTYCQIESWEQISVKFESKCKGFHSRKCIWKCWCSHFNYHMLHCNESKKAFHKQWSFWVWAQPRRDDVTL